MFELECNEYLLEIGGFKLVAVSWNEEVRRFIDEEIVRNLENVQRKKSMAGDKALTCPLAS